MADYLQNNYYDIYELCIKCNEIFTAELNQVKSTEGNSEEEIIFKTVSLQYCLIAKQDLLSIFLLYQDSQFFTPQLILRNILEHFITYIFIRQNPNERAKQYSLSGIKRKRGVLKWIIEKNILVSTADYDKKINEFEEQYNQYKEDINKWPKEIGIRAEKAGIPQLYLIYRYLCIISHPDSNNSDFFFTEKNGVTIFNDFNEDNIVMTLFLALYMTNYLFSELNENFDLNMDHLHEELDKDIKQLLPNKD